MKASVVAVLGIVLAIACGAQAGAAKKKPATKRQDSYHTKAQQLASRHMGPFVNLPDGSVLGVGARESMISADEGKTWKAYPLFKDNAKFQARSERALLRTRGGVVVMGFLNQKELRRGQWKVKDKEALSKFFLPTYIVRSLDGGKTWEEPQKIQDGWCGAIRCLIQLKSGRLVLCGQNLVFDPGRHIVLTYTSDDDGKTWTASNILDIGGSGSHGGTMEATVAELADGRVWLLIRTTLGWFWEAYSKDGGRTWTGLRKSAIQSSTCCGMLARLASGRLALLWNRSPVGKPYSRNSREELSIAFSTDDGKTWAEPIVIARDPGKRQSYPYLFERRPGEFWITVMQGYARIRLFENDLVSAK